MSRSRSRKEPSTAEESAPTEAAATDIGGAFFRRIDWSAFWTVTLLVFGVYFATLAPTVTLEDSGELAVGSDYLGVPHPPGYPVWTLITWFFQWIFNWVKYYGQPDSSLGLIAKSLRELAGDPTLHGHPNPAWGVGLASAFFGALACGTLALLISRSGTSLLRSVPRLNRDVGVARENLFSWTAAVSGGLLLGFSPVLWSQSVIVEVYALNAFFELLVVLLLYRWMARPTDYRALYALAFVFGLGLTNHQTLLFLGLALAAGILVRDLALFRDFAIVGLGLALVVLVNVWGARTGQEQLLWVQGPAHTAFWVATALAVLIPVAGAFLLPRGRVVCFTFLLLELGVAFYLYLPFASDQNPPMNWGYPRTWDGFIHAIGRGQYERISPGDVFTRKFLEQVGMYLYDLRRQFTLPILLIGLLPFTAWRVTLWGRRVSAFAVALALALLSALLVLPEELLQRSGAAPHLLAGIVLTYRTLMFAIAGLAGLGFLVTLVGFLRNLARPAGPAGVMARFAFALALVAVCGVLLYIDVHIVLVLFGGGLTFMSALALCLVVVLPPPLMWAVYRFGAPPFELAFEASREQQNWLMTTLAGFISLSVIFIIFLNNSLDIQTLFIGRVQFIQSHALYALWLGYGLVLTLAFLDLFLRGPAPVRAVLVALALLLPAVLLLQNAYDRDQIRIVGGAEQNGHDFGWQFGAWELRGAKAILEELPPEERAAYPNPEYPPEMGPNAIFFGGTDPGRFVPTYMIYSADVRPDVYLITQNALADNTYMNVMRDLYGDRIWIPAQADSNRAFQQYVSDVRSGRINAGADVAFQDGRVSVQGVQGVMQINGILCRQIFEANRDRHDFYVEESYVIPWMYPYLQPNGLIMKLNRDPVDFTDAMAADDRAFWDWYARRLLGNPRFRRDVVARKTFSKLRSALAGLYVYRHRFAEAEYAFRQSIALYPLSPEANFRLADVFLQQGEFDKAISLMSTFLEQDPRNDKVAGFLDSIRGMQQATGRQRELEAELASGKIQVKHALELADLYRRFRQIPAFERLVRGLLGDPNIPLRTYLEIAQMASEMRRLDLVEFSLVRFLQRKPDDGRVWIDLAAVQVAQGRRDPAMQTIRAAIQRGGATVLDRLRSDRRFDPLRQDPEFRQLVPPAAPAAPLKLPGNLKGLIR